MVIFLKVLETNLLEINLVHKTNVVLFIVVDANLKIEIEKIFVIMVEVLVIINVKEIVILDYQEENFVKKIVNKITDLKVLVVVI